MKLTTEMSYPGAELDRVLAMLLDEDFRSEVCAATRALSHQVDITTRADGSADVTVSRVLPADVPDFVKKFVGETIRLVQSESWAAQDGSAGRHADLTLEVVGQPATMRGSIRLDQSPDGVHERVSGDLTVSVPFVGGKIESDIAKGLLAAARVEQQTGRDWLSR